MGEVHSGKGAPKKPVRILVVDDDEGIRRLLRHVLAREGYEVQFASNGDEALDVAVDHPPSLVILDLSLPGLTGLEVCRELRSWLPAPILVLSGTQEQTVKIEMLDLGADDYVTKPFDPGEMLARIRALLRRVSVAEGPPPLLSAGALMIDLARRRVLRARQEVRLTRIEFEILACLVRNADCVVTTRALLEAVWPEGGADARTLRVHVGHLRRKLEPEPSLPRYIVTELGIGYRLCIPESAAAGAGK